MALFDYSRKMEGEVLEPEVQPEAEQQVQAAPVMSGPVVLRQMPAKDIRASVKPGLLRVDFPDKESETGKGFMFVKPGDVRQSVSADGSPVAGRADVTISPDGQTTHPYFVIRQGGPVRKEKSVQAFVSEQTLNYQNEAEQARQMVQSREQLSDRSVERSADYE